MSRAPLDGEFVVDLSGGDRRRVCVEVPRRRRRRRGQSGGSEGRSAAALVGKRGDDRPRDDDGRVLIPWLLEALGRRRFAGCRARSPSSCAPLTGWCGRRVRRLASALPPPELVSRCSRRTRPWSRSRRSAWRDRGRRCRRAKRPSSRGPVAPVSAGRWRAPPLLAGGRLAEWEAGLVGAVSYLVRGIGG